MAQSLRPGFSRSLARNFLEDIQFRRHNFYYFLGKVDPWNVNDTVPTEPFVITEETARQIRSNILFSKKISPSDITLSVPRHDWLSGTVYDMWDNKVDMRDKVYYVLTDENAVYKCLDNAQGVPSTVKPSGKSLNTIRTLDGYLWKYMYSVDTFKRNRFMTQNLIPVQRALTDTFYNNGAVKEVVVLDGGSGYISSQLTTITVTGTTTGSGAEAELVLGPVGNIIDVTVIDGGSGYTKGVRVAVIGNGTGAELEAIINGSGVITGFDIVNGGVSYDEFSTVVFQLGLAEVVPVISSVTGSIVDAIIKDPGVGYEGNPTLTVNGVGTGKYGNASAIINAEEVDGSIEYVFIEDPGQDYVLDTSISVTVSGDGENALFTPVIIDGTIAYVLVENPGIGYNNIVLTVNSSTGSGAVIQGIIETSNLNSDQFLVEQTAVGGKIHAIKVTDGGNSYSTQTYIEILGNGNGCTADAVITGGILTRIIVTDPGEGYTNAIIRIVDPLRVEELVPEDFKASAYAIITPEGGHGKDAPLELNARYATISSTIKGDLLKYNIDQDFRMYGILRNPRNSVNGSDFTRLESLAVYVTEFSSTVGLNQDDILEVGYNRFIVVSIDNNNTVLLSPLDCMCSVPSGELTRTLDDTPFVVSRILDVTDFNKYSGDLLYISSEPAFNVSEEQSLTIKTTIKF
jgi:hypothetical protein